MKRELSGILTKTGQGFILYNHKGEVNLTEVLKTFWKLAVPIYVRVEIDGRRVLLNKYGDEIYYDKNSRDKYQLYIDGICIDDVLERAIFKQIYIIITTGKDIYYGRTNSKS